jgi:hypothetical protein
MREALSGEGRLFRVGFAIRGEPAHVSARSSSTPGSMVTPTTARLQFLFDRLLVPIGAARWYPRAAAGSGADSAGESGMTAGVLRAVQEAT